MQLQEIQTLTENFSTEHRALAALVQDLEDRIADLRKKAIPAILDQVARTLSKKSELLNALYQSPGLFKKPRTYIFGGVKVGYQKQKGKVVIQDEDATIAKMQKMFGDDEAAKYCNVKVTVDKKAASQIPGDILKKLGIELTADTDTILINTLESEVEKIVAALLEKAGDEPIQLDQVRRAA